MNDDKFTGKGYTLDDFTRVMKLLERSTPKQPEIIFLDHGHDEELKRHFLQHHHDTQNFEGDIRPFPNASGIKLVTVPGLDTKEWKQFRFPRSKKKRIRKKWAKNPKNFKMVDVHNILWVSPPCVNFAGRRKDFKVLFPSFIGDAMVSASVTPHSFKDHGAL